MNYDLISRQSAIDNLKGRDPSQIWDTADIEVWINSLPSAQPTLYGYSIEHLVMIVNVMKKENISPHDVVEMLSNVGTIAQMVMDEMHETLKKAVNECGLKMREPKDG